MTAAVVLADKGEEWPDGEQGRHRRFGNVRKLPSGRYQIRYPGPDGRMRTGPETFERKSDAEKALMLIEAQMTAGSGPIPSAGRSSSPTMPRMDRAAARPSPAHHRSVPLAAPKHIAPYLGGVPLGKLSTAMIREWRASCSATAFRSRWRPRLTGCCGRC